MSADSDPKGELERALVALAQLLHEREVEHWEKWARKALELLQAGDAHASVHLLHAYGGMGSFNDLYVCPENGHALALGELKAVNDALDQLRSRIYTLATGLSRGEQSGHL